MPKNILISSFFGEKCQKIAKSGKFRGGTCPPGPPSYPGAAVRCCPPDIDDYRTLNNSGPTHDNSGPTYNNSPIWK